MSWKKMVFGEKMPDKDDPKYQKRRDKEVEAGRKTARALRLDKLAGIVQRFAVLHPKIFLVVVFGLITSSLGYNVSQTLAAWHHRQQTETAAQRQDRLLEQKGVIPHHNKADGLYTMQQKLIGRQVDTLTAKGQDMTHEDSLKVKLLLKRMVGINKQKQECHDGHR